MLAYYYWESDHFEVWNAEYEQKSKIVSATGTSMKPRIALLKYVLAVCRTATLWSKVAFDVIKVMIEFKSLTTDDIIEHESRM